MTLAPRSTLALTTLLFLAPGAANADGLTTTKPMGIVGGTDVGVCGWPTVVSTDAGCTGTLLHPQAISTAQHCLSFSTVTFTDQLGGPSQTRAVTQCVDTGSQDARICLLSEPVLDLPVTPALFGCELDKYLKVGQPVIIAGFGQTAFGQGGGEKLWANQTITAVEPDRVIIGNAGDPQSPCPGDSGGPVFLQVEDGSWRVFGTVLGGTTMTPCNSAADFRRIDPVVPNFEAATGVDITPCFDGATGEWDPTEACGGFFAGDHTGSGTWPDWCAGTPASNYSGECGDPFGNVETDGGSSGGGSGGGSSTGDDSAGTSASGGGSGSSGTTSQGGTDSATETGSTGDTDGTGQAGDDEGCACSNRPVSTPAWLIGLVLMAGRARRCRG